MKNSKRIHSVTIKRIADSDTDTSHYGEYSGTSENEYSIDRKHSVECASQEFNHRETVDRLERIITYLQTSEPESDFYDGDATDVLIEAQESAQECDCTGGDMDRNQYRYFNPNVENYKGEPSEDIRKYCLQDYERMERLNRGSWGYIGIIVEAEYSIGKVNGDSELLQTMSSGGLWGIESDSGESYLTDIEKEEMANLRKQLEGIGFSKRAVTLAFKSAERKEE